MPCGDPFVDAAEKAVLAGNPFRFGNEANFEILTDLALWLSENGHATSSLMVKRAIAEITRLRASQFRWIPVTETKPETGVSIIARKDGEFVLWRGFSELHMLAAFTHWAPIPPLPEQSQGEKDEELWRKHLGTGDAAYVDSYAREIAHLGFIQGLKAARGEKL